MVRAIFASCPSDAASAHDAADMLVSERGIYPNYIPEQPPYLPTE